MDTRLTQKDIFDQFFKYCTKFGEIKIRYEHGRIIAGLEQLADLAVETLEEGLVRMTKNHIDAKLYELRDTAKAQKELELDLQAVSDLLVSQGTSVDADYKSDADDVKGG